MIRTVRELLDEIKNQIGDHDENEVPVTVEGVGAAENLYLTLEAIDFFDGHLIIRVHQ